MLGSSCLLAVARVSGEWGGADDNDCSSLDGPCAGSSMGDSSNGS